MHQDLVQEIILQLWLSFDRYDHQFKYSTWIYRIALNTAISFYRKGVVERKYSAALLPQYENIIAGKADYEQNPNLKLLHQFIQELKEIDKALILLYLEEMSHKEISAVVGISPTNVGTRLSRIKKILQKKFKSSPK